MGQRRAPEPDAAYTAFFATHHPRVVASLTLSFGDEQVAHDAAADAFAKALLRWDQVGAMASPAGWVHRVALHNLRRHHRRRDRERELLARFPASELVGAPEPALEVWAALARLPERQRTAAVLRWAADLTEVEIARIMGVRRSTVSATLAKARSALERLLPGAASETVVSGGSHE
jgi:RNA polymerase sigma-70 factor (ECF subfamily)